jgi:hypothetical protein
MVGEGAALAAVTLVAVAVAVVMAAAMEAAMEAVLSESPSLMKLQ